MTEVGFKDGKAKDAALTSCKGATLTLTGTSTWATDGKAITGFTDYAKSDGYKAVLVNTFTTVAKTAKTWGLWIEGPNTTKSSVFGIWAAGKADADTLAAVPAIGWWAPDTFKIAAVTAPTAITLATNGLVQICKDSVGADAAAMKTSYEAKVLLLTTAGTLTSTWYQPKQEATNIYKTMPRFSKKDKVKTYGGDDANATKAVACSAGIELTGASALVAGAAVMFGASALAF